VSRAAAEWDVLVAGAGPAGSATAIRLARAGLRTLLVDRATFPREKICSEYMSPETLRHLALLGVLPELERAGGAELRGTTVVAPRGSRLTGLFARAGPAPFRDMGRSLPRRLLDHILVEEARRAGAEVWERTAVVGVVEAGRQVQGCVLRRADRRDQELRARVTVGADGLRSRLSRALGPRRYGLPRRYAFVAHVAGVEGLGDTTEMHVMTDGYAGLNPLGGGLANVAVVVPEERAVTARGRPAHFWHEALEAIPGVRGRVSLRDLVREVLVSGPFAAQSTRVVRDGMLLVGDAADFFDPFTGEGICAALRGAELAAGQIEEALARPGGGPVAAAARLRGYASARRRAFLGKWIVERMIGYAMYAPWLFDRAVARLERRGLSHTLIGVTGDYVPASAVLNPSFLMKMVM